MRWIRSAPWRYGGGDSEIIDGHPLARTSTSEDEVTVDKSGPVTGASAIAIRRGNDLLLAHALDA
jgi:hypothetical protein